MASDPTCEVPATSPNEDAWQLYNDRKVSNDWYFVYRGVSGRCMRAARASDKHDVLDEDLTRMECDRKARVEADAKYPRDGRMNCADFHRFKHAASQLARNDRASWFDRTLAWILARSLSSEHAKYRIKESASYRGTPSSGGMRYTPD